MMDLVYICHRIDALSERCANMTPDQINKHLDGISKDLKEVAFKIAMRSKNVWNLTGAKEDEYTDWYWNSVTEELLSDDEKEEITEALKK